MLALALSLVLTASTAKADEPIEKKPCTITPLKLRWFDVDGTPYRWQQIEGWMLTDPSSRPHAIKADRMRKAGGVLTSLGATAAIVGAGFAFRSFDDDDGTTILDWLPIVGGGVMIAAGIPLIYEANHQEKKAVEVWGMALPRPDGATVSVGGRF